MNNSDNSRLVSLLRQCRTGDDNAFSLLVADYTPMLKGEIAKLSLPFDESFSEACVALYKAALNFDLNQSEVTFGLYASICVKRRLLDMLRKEKRGSQEAFISDVDVDDIAVPDGIISRLLYEEENESFKARAREVLSKYEYDVFRLWLLGLGASDISERLSTDVKSVENAKARVLKKLRSGMSR